MQEIKVVLYNPNWPSMFEAAAEKIKLALSSVLVAIHHIGSTSVPGLPSKPTIDIMAEVSDLNFDYQGLLNLNYQYKGGFNLPLRKCFTYRSKGLNVNLHIFENNDPEVELNLTFRNYLRENNQDRDEYAKLKYKILKSESSQKKDGSMKVYTLKKSDFIQNILKKSSFNRLHFVICAHYAEWEAAKNFRNKYFFNPNGIEDPYTWTFNHQNHKHLILYQGVDIVGYAHIQLWTQNRAAIRIIVIDEKYRSKNYGKNFIRFIEKWLKLEGYQSIHTESSPQALGFYKKLNYIAMPFNDPDGYEGSPEDIPTGKVL